MSAKIVGCAVARATTQREVTDRIATMDAICVIRVTCCGDCCMLLIMYYMYASFGIIIVVQIIIRRTQAWYRSLSLSLTPSLKQDACEPTVVIVTDCQCIVMSNVLR